MDLKDLEKKLNVVRQESRDLDWYMAVYKANKNYREKYIDGLSLNYRQCCEWWHEIGDDLFVFFKREPFFEAQIKKWYFEEYLKGPSPN